ncbi:hypothetical protein [Aeromicrobium erythreum]|uniref:Uncharacterized protein n=1 Tax=Aeromicrobium erythreum TaxID=2041 RepID=A0A0U3KP11_9ACTN|nr:hypothetical protein [Aeromicrobium erythreum]ALX06227.1 hypothetical protein AERYTH_16760 [Aeromicrobium erythreum]
MRTTLSVDPRVLAVARARVAAGLDASIGEAVSALALAGIESTQVRSDPEPSTRNGIVLIPSDPGAPVVTDEMVADLLDEE